MERPDHKKSCTHSLPEAWQGLAHPAHRSTCKVFVDFFSRNCEELNFNSAKLCKVEENKDNFEKRSSVCVRWMEQFTCVRWRTLTWPTWQIGGPGLKHHIDHWFEERVGDSHSDHDFNGHGVMRFDEKEFYLQLTNLEKILWTGGWRH